MRSRQMRFDDLGDPAAEAKVGEGYDSGGDVGGGSALQPRRHAIANTTSNETNMPAPATNRRAVAGETQ
jgi:hypothetical protein